MNSLQHRSTTLSLLSADNYNPLQDSGIWELWVSSALCLLECRTSRVKILSPCVPLMIKNWDSLRPSRFFDAQQTIPQIPLECSVIGLPKLALRVLVRSMSRRSPHL
jgi:hypothetical protein